MDRRSPPQSPATRSTSLLAQLEQFDFCRLWVTLELAAAADIPAEAGLRLRRDLHRAGRDGLCRDDFLRLFDPPLPADPSALRRFQRPAPAFVLSPVPGLPGHFEPGDTLVLPVTFFGSGIQLIGPFLDCLARLGRRGLWQGEGPFEMGGIEVAGVQQERHLRSISAVGAGSGLFVHNGRWWLEEQPAARCWTLAFDSPARLLTAGRPLFNPTLGALFPFVLRRVTSMAYHQCGLELDLDPQSLVQAAADIEVVENRLAWKDWRSLESTKGGVDLGGVGGRATFLAPGEPTLLRLLMLGSLLNIGKGAAFGAGHYRLEPAVGQP